MKEEYTDSGRTKQKSKTRSRILESAQHFMGQGKAFTLEDIAAHTGISRATIYRYYSKVEILSLEAGLDFFTKNTDEISGAIDKEKSLEDRLLSVQDYFNQLTLDNEAAFRKYIGSVLTADSIPEKRGARRVTVIEDILKDQKEIDLNEGERRMFTHVATMLMGGEAITVAKDVCRLDDAQSTETLIWGLKLLLEGMRARKSSS